MTCSCDETGPHYHTTNSGTTKAVLQYRITDNRVLQTIASGTITIALPGADEDAEPTPIATLTNLAGVVAADQKRIFWRPAWGGGSGQMPLITERDTKFFARWRLTDPDGYVWVSSWIPWTADP
jgi:hypothetical protein